MFVATVCSVSVDSAQAKMVYAITDHDNSTLKGYNIHGDELESQATGDIRDYAVGAVGITADSQLQRLFVTYEAPNQPRIIVWANALNMKEEGSVTVPNPEGGVQGLAGIVADEGKKLVYAVTRERDKLYILGWDNQTEQLELRDPNDPSQPYEGDPQTDAPYITLVNLGGYGAYGLALDGNRLYVSNNTSSVHYYDTDSWAHLGTRDVGRNSAGVAIDPNNGHHNAYLYIGALYTGTGTGHNYLVKHDLEADVNPNTENNIGTVPIGLAVDPNSGFVYVGTSDREIRIYDCSEPDFVYTDPPRGYRRKLRPGGDLRGRC